MTASEILGAAVDPAYGASAGARGGVAAPVRPPVGPPRRSWVTSRLVVRPSPIAGMGLFAVEDIKAGGLCLLLGGQLLDDAELDQVRRTVPNWSALALGEGRQLLQADDDPARFVNHSCDPSLWLTSATTVVARRRLRPGDESTLDYALATVDDDWSMACHCGTVLCRGVVTGADWHLPALQARYAGHFSPFIQRRIAAVSA